MLTNPTNWGIMTALAMATVNLWLHLRNSLQCYRHRHNSTTTTPVGVTINNMVDSQYVSKPMEMV